MKYIYKLYINGVDYLDFNSLKDLNEYCFINNINYDNPKIFDIRVVKIKTNGR